MKRKTYPKEFKEQALRKTHERGTKTLQDIADEQNLPLGTLKNWLKESGNDLAMAIPGSTPAASWNAAQRLTALNESYSLKDQALHAWCREKGLFEHQLRQWSQAFCQIDKPAPPVDGVLRQARQKSEQLERELRRKEKALAEVAALLVLQKKFQSLWEAEEK